MNPYPPPPAWADEITSVGVTGTNGKSSTARFVAAGLTAAGDSSGGPGGAPVARVTTVDAAVGDELGPPPANHDVFLELMATLRRRGGRYAALETTSATLGLGFAKAWPFRVGVFTNLGHDHLRTHGSFEHYLASKAQLFVALEPGGAAVLNARDPSSTLIAEILGPEVRQLWFAGPGPAPETPVDLWVRRARSRWSGLGLELEVAPAWDLPRELELRVVPEFQAANVAAALLACVALGIPGLGAAQAIGACPAPTGRFELVSGEGRPRVVIDYAHTPEALAAALASARALTEGRVLLVIGAGGDTDAGKRSPLGAAAAAADGVWLTNDNPRHEDPHAIVQDLCRGLGSTPSHIELDRGRAIALAIAQANADDVVLIAGKGHERVQEIGDERVPMSDHALAQAALGEVREVLDFGQDPKLKEH